MNYFARYSAYLKDNPEGYWFKRKLHGWGWTPAKKEGWLTLLVWVIIFGWIIVPFSKELQPTNSETTWFLIKIIAWVAVLILVCYMKGEKPKWQWGLSKDTNN